ncbi:MAG: GTP cyclohydrolase I FolE [Pantoea sp. Brub]|nr:GTP cyclohydrolase I FolE [Pantoea sp. Brub]
MINDQAYLIHKTLLKQGLETPFYSLNFKQNNDIRKKTIAKYIKKILILLNLNLENNSLIKTPMRIADMFVNEIFSGLDYNNFPKISFIKNIMKTQEMITVSNIILTSICEHHLLIIDGQAIVSYLPKDKIIGLSKINRVVRFFSQRPQIQERLTQQILIAFQTLLATNDVAISINAVHYCVKARGIKDATSKTTTTSLGGLFETNTKFRQEFLQLIPL